MNTLLVSFLVATVALAAVNAVPAEKKSQSNSTTVEQPGSGNVTTVEKPGSANASAPADMAEAMVKLLQAYRRIMPCGDPSLNIPILAPYRIKNIAVNIEEELLTVNGKIKDLVMTGINDFVIINFATNSTNNRTSFDILYKGLQILGDFDLAVNADLAGYRFIQKLKGLLDLQVLNVRVTGGLTAGVNQNGGMVFSDVDFYVQVGDIVSNTLELDWSVAVNDFFNRYLSDSSLLFLQTNREFVNEMISGYYTPMLNDMFAKITPSEYMEALVIATEMYDSIECNP